MAKLEAMFFDYMDLFLFHREDWLDSFISNDMYQVRCSCKTVKRIIDIYAAHPLAKRKAARRAYTIRRFPTFVRDCEVWGEPTVLIPLPTWHVWKVWRVRRLAEFSTRGLVWSRAEWKLIETHWLRNLSEMATLENRFGGLCTYVKLPFNVEVRFEVRSYTWDYKDKWWWVEENHV